ncbi:MAG: type II secretion system protein [Candidatus Eremiobacteraeota bacterium]|nr:type II secretion system protein [Candidatus Eremiobacteraeota bacterium]
MRPERRGFTLIETLITLAVFSLLLVLIFGTFSMSTSIFQDTDVRQSTEIQMKSIKLLLQRDVELSDFWFMNSVSRVQGDSTYRDALSISTLGDWDNAAEFDATTGRPTWSRYVVWYATQETPGRMIRQVVDGGGAALTGPYADLSININETPGSNANVLYSRTLSDRVKDFRVDTRLQNGTVEVKLRLESRGAGRPNSMQRTVDNLELTLTFRPRNTWPQI